MGRSLLDALSVDQRRALEARSSRKTLEPGEVLFHHGARGDYLAVVERGRLAVQISTLEGQTATFRVAGRGDVVGEFALLLPAATRSATIVAIERAELLIVQRAAFEEVRRGDPGIDRALVGDLASRLHLLSGELMAARYGTVGQRVASHLLVLDEVYRQGWIPLTQEDLASLVGGTRQTVNKALGAAREAGLLGLRRGGVRVLDREGLARTQG